MQFAILNIEGKKKENLLEEGALTGAPSAFWAQQPFHHRAHRGSQRKFKGKFIFEFGAMIKKKAKKTTKAAGKKSGKKSTSTRKQMDPAKVREEIAGMVKVEAPK